MQVKVLSREMIKPSSPTPSHLKTIKLSLFDQLSYVIYTPIIFFYSLNKNDETYEKNAISTLKKSLSETLRHFYLLAGRIKDRSIDCNDEGALYLEASVDCSMSDFLKEPNNDMLGKLLPPTPLCTKPLEEHAHIVAQLNTFKCGAISISLCFFHKLIDAETMSCFLRTWASINRGTFDSSQEVICYDYKALSSLFPQIEGLPFHQTLKNKIDIRSQNSQPKTRLQSQRFVFDAKAISDLKRKAKSVSVPNPTAVEVVTGFIWKYVMEAASVRLAPQNLSLVTHVVNLRKRMNPPLPESSIGNIFGLALSHYEANKVEVELDELVNLLRKSFAEIDIKYIQKFTGEKGNEAVLESLKEHKELFSTIPCITFSSWRNMNFNDVDFGWGKPVWINVARHPSIDGNFILLLDTISGDGIEACMQLDENEMELLMQNSEFLEFALLNPSIHLP